jgi:hypothetical protein
LESNKKQFKYDIMKKILLCIVTTVLVIVNGYSGMLNGATVVTGKVSGLRDVGGIPIYYSIDGNTQQLGVLTYNSGVYRIELPSRSSTIEIYVSLMINLKKNIPLNKNGDFLY